MLKTIGQILICAVAFKALVGFHFPWEPFVKTKKALAGKIKLLGTYYNVPQDAREDMLTDLESLN